MNPPGRRTSEYRVGDETNLLCAFRADESQLGPSVPEKYAMSGDEAKEMASLAFELGTMKRIRRTGWWHAGVELPESIADHSLRVAQIATLIASLEGASVSRASLLGLWHDSQETRTGDLPHTARPYVTTDKRAISQDQTAGLPDQAARVVLEAVEEYESQTTPESLCASDADKLDCFFQAIEYRHAGYYYVDSWLKSSQSGFRLPTTRQMATAALDTAPTNWRDRWMG
jgi:putative hydrolases of HD superfamily